jgi:hypothetical protein
MELARSPANAKERLLISGLSAGRDRLEEDFAQPDGSAGEGACGAGRRFGSRPM